MNYSMKTTAYNNQQYSWLTHHKNVRSKFVYDLGSNVFNNLRYIFKIYRSEYRWYSLPHKLQYALFLAE